MTRTILAMTLALSLSACLSAQTVLTYHGTNNGDWFAPNVWQDEQGTPQSWQSGSIAVIPDNDIKLTADTEVYQLRGYFTAKHTITGSGKLTIGAGGIQQLGNNGEINIMCSGGVTLSASQEWSGTSKMICFDGNIPVIAAPGVNVSCSGTNLAIRINADLIFTQPSTFYVEKGAYLSFSSGGTLTGADIIVQGSRDMLQADGSGIVGSATIDSTITLRDNANISLRGSKLGVDTIAVDYTNDPATSFMTGTTTPLLRDLTFDIAQNSLLAVATTFGDNSGTPAKLYKTGSGSLTLTNASTFSGGFDLQNGAVTFVNASAGGSGPINLAANTTLTLAGGSTCANNITGSGTLICNHNTTLHLTGNLSYTGSTELHNGTTMIDAITGFASTTGSINISPAARLALTDKHTINPTSFARLAGSGALLAAADSDITLQVTYSTDNPLYIDALAGGTMRLHHLTGSGFVKQEAGKLCIADTTGYSGEILVENGTLYIGSTDILAPGVTIRTTGSGTVQVDSQADIDLTRLTGTQRISLTDGSAITLDTDNATTPGVSPDETLIITSLTGSNDLYKYGPGTMIIQDASTFSGKIHVIEGELNTASAMGNNTANISGGTMRITGTTTVMVNTFNLTSGKLIADSGASLGSSSISLAANTELIAVNQGTLGSGTLTINSGTLILAELGNAGTRQLTLSSSGRIKVYHGPGLDDATLSLSGGTLEFLAPGELNAPLTLTANTTIAANTPSGAATPTIATINSFIATTARSKLLISGNGEVVMAGGGEFISSGEIFVIGNGSLSIVSNKVVVTGYAGIESSGKRITIADDGTLEMNGSGKNLHAGHGSSTVATFEVLTGGVFRAAANVGIVLGASESKCLLRICGGLFEVENLGQFTLDATSKNEVKVLLESGGVLKTSRQIKVISDNNAHFVFNGGTLQSDGINSYSPWLANSIPITVTEKGGIIDAQGVDMDLGGSVLTGAGQLTLSNGSTLFSSPSPAWSGGLQVTANATAAASSDYAFGSGVVNLNASSVDIRESVMLPNTFIATDTASAFTVAADKTASIAMIQSPAITKQGSGTLISDCLSAELDIVIAGGTLSLAQIEATQLAGFPAGTPAIWMDATVSSSFSVNESGGISYWFDRRNPGDTSGFYATPNYNKPIYVNDGLACLPLVDFGVMRIFDSGDSSGDNRMLQFKTTQHNIRTVFWVIGSRNGGGFLLGDSVTGGNRHFHRGSSSGGTYGSIPADPLWHSGSEVGFVRNGVTWLNGEQVNGTATGLSGNYDLVSWSLTEAQDQANQTPFADMFASCYNAPNGRLNGGQELGEVLIYTNRLSDIERVTTEQYLTRKWFPDRTMQLTLGTITLAGANTSFTANTGYEVAIAQVIVDAANTTLAGEVDIAELLVTPNGTLDLSDFAGLKIANLIFDTNATLALTMDNNNTVPHLELAGTLELPSKIQLRVTPHEELRIPAKILLATADTNLTSPVGGTESYFIEGSPSGLTLQVDTAKRELWLKASYGTQLLLR